MARVVRGACALMLFGALAAPWAADAAPAYRIDATLPGAPSASGWYAEPVDATFAVRGIGKLEQCRATASSVYPDAPALSSVQYERNRPVSSCRITGSLERSGIVAFSLWAKAGRWNSTRQTTLRVDLDAPSIRVINAPSTAMGAVRVHGEATDGFSGIEWIQLEIADALDREAPTVVAATCDGCGAYHGCFHAGQCGWRTEWEFRGAVPPGIREVTAVVRDLAGNTARAEPFTLLVLP